MTSLANYAIVRLNDETIDDKMSAKILFDMLTPAIGQLTFSQPARRNALNAQMWADLPKVLAKATKTEGLRVLIVTGAGEHFSAALIYQNLKHFMRPPKARKK